jgi:hypothetical protein
VLNSPTVDGAVKVAGSNLDSAVATMCKQDEGALYVFAVNMRNRATTAVIELLTRQTRSEARVLGEDRSLPIDGRFEDEFEAYAVHLYRIEGLR